VGIFLIIVFYIFSKTILEKGVEIKHKVDGGGADKNKFAAFSVVGVLLVIISSWFVTDQALYLASHLSLSQTLLGATILSLGTTMPELSIGISALRRKNIELAIGDGIGSVVSNITVILGIASIINPINIDIIAKVALIFLIFVSWIFVFIAKEVGFDKKTGAMLLILYAFYVIMMMRLA
jgi:cation:H+ antiporter